mgnify:CR=1 FL=1
MSVLIYIENTDGKLKKSAFEAASYGKAIANLLNTEAIALSIGNVATVDLEKLGNYGISKVLNASSSNLSSFVNQAYASIIAAASQKENATIIVLSNTFTGKGLAPRLAAKLAAGLVTGATKLPTLTGNTLEVQKTVFYAAAGVYGLGEKRICRKSSGVVQRRPSRWKSGVGCSNDTGTEAEIFPVVSRYRI